MTIDLHQLNGELAEVMGSTAPDRQRLYRAAGILRHNTATVRAVLRAAVSDGPLAAAIAEHSYWHANGFAKLVLHRNLEPRFQLRLHVWGAPRDSKVFEYENIHGHRWEFVSTLLCGRLVSEEFEESADLDDPSVDEYDKFEYRSPTSALAGKLHSVGTCGLRSVGATKYGTNDYFYCALHTVHRVVPLASGITATAFLQGPSRVPSAFVYQAVGRDVIQDTGASISTGEVRALAAATLDAMDMRDS